MGITQPGPRQALSWPQERDKDDAKMEPKAGPELSHISSNTTDSLLCKSLDAEKEMEIRQKWKEQR